MKNACSTEKSSYGKTYSRPSILEKADRFDFSREFKAMGLYPYYRRIRSSQGPEILLENGKKAIMLGSNSYLGLTTHPEVLEAAENALRKYGTGCAGSRFLNGTTDLHAELEAELADWLEKEDALVFSTGFQTNLGVVAALAGRKDVLFLDRQNHASIIDGARLAFAKYETYPHNDASALEKLLSATPENRGKMIVSDGVFSMEGDICDLPGLVQAAEKYGAAVMIDDAHGLGTMGREGAGVVSEFNLAGAVDLIMGTFSKALASVGGFVAADRRVVEFLRHGARTIIFSASLPPASAAAALAAVKIVRREPERIERLQRNTNMMKEGLQSIGFRIGNSRSPIVPVHVGDMLVLAKFVQCLEQEGVFANPVIPPAIPPGQALLRISLMATHTKDQIEKALAILSRTARTLEIVGSAT